jgi:asparagine synthase (glutamine-hydrolysing)
LSGGLDSSLIAAAAAAVTDQKIQTYTISFPGFGHYDESAYAKQISEYFSTDHNCVSFSEGDFLNEMIRLMNVIDEPIGDSSLLPTALLSRITRCSATVALGGDGGDELFGGYSSYRNVCKAQSSFFGSSFSKIGQKIGNRLPLGFRGRTFLGSLGPRDEQWFSATSMIFNEIDRDKIFSSRLKNNKFTEIPELYKLKFWSSDFEPAESAMRADFLSYLPSNILTKVDRASMVHSLEVRSPFLSNAIIDYAFHELPVQYKVCGPTLKVLLKEIARRHLPENFLTERKQGFSIPPSLFNCKAWRDLACDSIEYLPEDFFNLKYIRKIFKNGHRSQTANSYMFPLVMLASWYKRFGT